MAANEISALAEATLRSLSRQARMYVPGLKSAPVGEQLVALTSTVEAYVDNVLTALIGTAEIYRHPLIEAMYKELEDQIFQSWPSRYRWLRVGFGVSIAGDRSSQCMDTLVDLRNCIVHGNGRMTDRQTRDLKKMIEMEHQFNRVLSVTVERRNVHLSPRTFGLAVEVCRSFVLRLDESLRTKYPDLKV